MQQALLKQRVGAAHPLWQNGKPAPHHDIKTPRRGAGKSIAFSFLTVLLLHAAVIALLITRTTEYTPLNLVSPTESVSIEAALVEEPEPVAEAAPDEPPVLTSDHGEREIAPIVEQQPTPPEPLAPPVKREVKKAPPKPQVKPRPVQPKTVPQPQSAARTERPSASASPTTAAELTPGHSRGDMMKNNPTATPKHVASVGCAVPQPEYPRRARRLHQEGEVLIRLVIDPEGRLIRHEIARGSGYEALDQAAMSAVAQARCTPYRENGRAISVMTLQPVNFKLSR